MIWKKAGSEMALFVWRNVPYTLLCSPINMDGELLNLPILRLLSIFIYDIFYKQKEYTFL